MNPETALGVPVEARDAEVAALLGPRAVARPPPLLVKMCVLGEAGVGKTALVRRIVNDEFDDDTRVTVGIDFSQRTIDGVPAAQQGRRVALQFWDTAGQERYARLMPVYMRDTDMVVLVYALPTDGTPPRAVQTQRVLEYASRVLEAQRDRTEPLPIVVVGAKLDLVLATPTPAWTKALHDWWLTVLAPVCTGTDRVPAPPCTATLSFFEASARTRAGIDQLLVALDAYAVAHVARRIAKTLRRISSSGGPARDHDGPGDIVHLGPAATPAQQAPQTPGQSGCACGGSG